MRNFRGERKAPRRRSRSSCAIDPESDRAGRPRGPARARAAAAPPGAPLDLSFRGAASRRPPATSWPASRSVSPSAARPGGSGRRRRSPGRGRSSVEIDGLAVEAAQSVLPRKGPAPVVEKTRRRLLELEERRAALTSSSPLVIPFADGRLDPSGWHVLENVACLASTSSSNDLAREVIELYFEEDQELPAVPFRRGEPAAGPRPEGTLGGAGRAGALLHGRPPAEGPEPIRFPSSDRGRALDARGAARRPTGVARGAEVAQRPLRRSAASSPASSPRPARRGTRHTSRSASGSTSWAPRRPLGVPSATTLEEEIGPAPPAGPAAPGAARPARPGARQPALEGRSRAHGNGPRSTSPGDRDHRAPAGKRADRGSTWAWTPPGFSACRTDAGETVVSTGELAEW